ncbi:hypothetical protein F4803DRAFT_556676 [Xylaria telfairii]|nr:hypothetical protein F4803DRAFT_556676 [Xylaria telfairii]
MGFRNRAQRLVTIFKSPSQHLHREQKPESRPPQSYFLQLPVELVLLIAEYLTDVDLALLSQTCKSLHFILGNRRISRCDRFLYLVYRSRGLPGEWACESCKTLHPISVDDTPRSFRDQSSCPRAKKIRRRYDTDSHYNPIRIDRRHVELAVKYTLLQQREYNSYLKALTAPYHAKLGSMRVFPLKIHYSAYPKVVVGDDGNMKFLLLSTWRYYKGYGDIYLDDIEFPQICPHLQMYGFGDCSLVTLARRNRLEAAVLEALEAQGDGGQGRAGACTCCATDFFVRFTYKYLDLYVWQELGPGSSHLNCGCWSEFSYPRFPGAIRALYGPKVPKQPARPRKRIAEYATHVHHPMEDNDVGEEIKIDDVFLGDKPGPTWMVLSLCGVSASYCREEPTST